MSSSRQRKLDAVVAQLQLRYGPRAIRKAAPAPEPLPRLPTTFPALDAALGGGLPTGRITEVCGQATSGKVTLAAKTLVSAQARPEAIAAWLDLPRACDPEYLQRCGLDLARLLVVRPRDATDGLAIARYLVESRVLAALVCDGMAELLAADAGVVAAGLEYLATAVPQTPTALIFLSEPQAQCRTLAHVAAVRLMLRREQWIRRGRDVCGYTAQVTVAKHRLGREGTTVPIRITFNGGVYGE